MTTRYAALLRGINVSGHKKVPMAELRTLLTELGHADVRTYLQSGNAVFSSASGDEDALTAQLEQAIEERFGFAVPCLIRNGPYLASVADACPFPAAALEGKQLHVTYFDRPVDADTLRRDRRRRLPPRGVPARRPCALPLRPRRTGPFQARRGAPPPLPHQGPHRHHA